MKRIVYLALMMAAAVSCNNFSAEEIALISEGEGTMRVLKSNDAADASVLRLEAEEVSGKMMASAEYEKLCSRMLLTVQAPENDGVGIAAPQVGVSRRVVAVQRFDKEGEPFEVYANPEIVRYGAAVEPGAEGCLSVDGLRGTVSRSQEIDVRYVAADGSDVTETVKGFTAVIFQHEIDHLDGILYTDKASSYGNDYLQTRIVDNGARLTWIQDNAAPRLMQTGIFAGADKAMVESLGLQDGVPASVSVFLLEKDGLRILFDAGNGTPDSRMPEAFKTLGIGYEDIDYVYITHLHGDHIGGMFKGDAAAFPEAQVYMAQAEHDGWVNMEGRNAQTLKLLAAYDGRVNLFVPGTILPGEVETIDAKGHTPGHTVYGTGNYLILGDLMHGIALQIPNPDVCASFDSDMEASIASRKTILRYAADNGLNICGMHFPPPGFLE